MNVTVAQTQLLENSYRLPSTYHLPKTPVTWNTPHEICTTAALDGTELTTKELYQSILIKG